MKKKIFILFILLIFISNGVSYAEKLNLSAQSHILMDEVSGRVLMEHNSHNKMAMASTTKIMTALIALENSDLDDIVTIDERSINIEGSSIYLANKEEISMRDLLYGLMLRSGNDSAIAIANHVSGSEEAFINLMNEKAKSLKAFNTNFVNPHGLSAEDHYSTAFDLAIITREAFKYDVFKEIVSAKSYKANREGNGYFINKNKTLWEYKGGNGVKIGYTMAAGRCLVSSAIRDGMGLIAVSLNAPNWFNDNYQLMDYGFDNYKPYNIYGKHQFIKKIQITTDDLDLNIVTENELILPLKEGEKNSIKVNIKTFDNFQLPIKKGEVVGKIDTYLDGVLIKSDNLISKDDINKKSLIERFFMLIYN
ncbi:MAG: D-alanyl-D-alanine carboxypeptidase family protein [Tissierellaceae bacterium]|nr:D-alanyl-D-alanine carboxypeptidase family protein [Tissierellaceae bacterium]